MGLINSATPDVLYKELWKFQGSAFIITVISKFPTLDGESQS